MKAKIRALTRRKSQQNPGTVLIRINQILRGWANYFRHAACKRTLSRLFHFVWWRVIRWLRALHRWRWKDVRRRFTTPDGRWKPIEAEGVTLFNPASVPVTRYRYRGNTIPNPWTLRYPCLTAATVESPVRVRRARRVRRAAWGNGPRVIPAPRPRPTQPEKAIVLCVDEKSQVQALDRTQPSLPMEKGRAGTMTHDYKRHGTTTLFAALDVLTGMVIRQCMPRHRHQEFLKFLRTIDSQVPKDLAVHLILDNYATHNHADVRLAGPPSAVPPALHPDLVVVAQPGRTLVPRTHRQGAAPWRLPLRARPRHRDRGIPRRPQRRPQTLRLDRHRRIDPGQGRRGRITLEKVVTQCRTHH